jgi:hypothetical protein
MTHFDLWSVSFLEYSTLRVKIKSKKYGFEQLFEPASAFLANK